MTKQPVVASGGPSDKKLTYEEAFARLESLIADLEAGDLPLEESLVRYEEGLKLAARCEEMLAAAELRVRQWQPAEDPTELDDWQDESL